MFISVDAHTVACRLGSGALGKKKKNYLLQSFSELGKAFSSSKDAKSRFLFPASYSWGPTLRTEQKTQKSKKEGRDKPIQGGKQQEQIRYKVQINRAKVANSKNKLDTRGNTKGVRYNNNQ